MQRFLKLVKDVRNKNGGAQPKHPVNPTYILCSWATHLVNLDRSRQQFMILPNKRQTMWPQPKGLRESVLVKITSINVNDFVVWFAG